MSARDDYPTGFCAVGEVYSESDRIIDGQVINAMADEIDHLRGRVSLSARRLLAEVVFLALTVWALVTR